ncbi:hypothetical protein C482_05952 [Natrialba chahannaoensis JCM 10990]|uniref:GLUG domain-containing protein n=1 Tax=Natrialba chahannaoensis JCM 10990 TaxID=1227492 RepID=M0AVC7_9EURY|nr:hypothetical protein [Natrialba chahannaoensis]ELZ01908.1 hypothetical protein C482_05952 [Natrialba chahannaoensis JCM 10990]
MVGIGAVLLFAAGSVMLDGIGSEVDREKAHLCMDETDHRLGTVASTGYDQSMALDDPDCQPLVVDDGSISITWYNSSDGEQPPWDNSSRTATEELGALELELDDRTLAHQGGAIWEVTESGVRTEKSPSIGFSENGLLELGFMQVHQAETVGSEGTLRHDHESESEAAANLTAAVAQAEEDVAIKIESEYAEGWKNHLESEEEYADRFPEFDVSVESTSDSNEVVMTIKEIDTAPEEPYFLIEEDHGLWHQGGNKSLSSHILEHGESFHINTTLTNYGNEPGKVTATLTIRDESGTSVGSREITSDDKIDPGQSISTADHMEWNWGGPGANHFFKAGNANGNHAIGVEPGEGYEYNVKTDPGGDSLNEPGQFIIEDDPPEVTITDVEDPVGQGDTLTVHADVEKRGYGDDQLVWLSGFDGNIVDTAEVDSDGSGMESVELEWGSVDLPTDSTDTEIAVGTESNSTTEAVEVYPSLNITDVDVLDDPVEEDGSVTVEAAVEAVGDTAETDVILEDFDGNEADSQSVTVPGADTETVELEYTGVGERTDRITVRTDSIRAEDDEMEEVVVVKRDGPQCDAVDYEGSGSEHSPYQISNVDQLQCINDQGLDDHYELVDDIDAHGTEYWNPVVSHSETVHAERGEFGAGDLIELSNTPVVERSVEVDAGAWNSDPDFELVDAESGVVEIQDNPRWSDNWEELYFSYDALAESGEPRGFEPIGQDGNPYAAHGDQGTSSGSFDGHFDGNGHLIEGLSIDRPDERFVGLFGATGHTTNADPVGSGSTIENVRLADVNVHGRQHVGGLVGQAGGAVIESRSEGHVEAQEQLVGGLIGDGAHANIDNELVAEGTVIGGDNLDGINGEGIGGLIGRSTWQTEVSTGYTQDMTVEYRPNGQPVDDYSHVGGIAGTSSYRDSTFEQMYSTATVEGYHGDAGAIVGTVLSNGDHFRESVYWNDEIETDAEGVDDTNGAATLDWIGLTTDEMQNHTIDEMANLDYEDDGGSWVAVPEDYPRFAWELEAEGIFEVDINDVENVTAGESTTIDVTVTSRDPDLDEEDAPQIITLTNPDGQVVDTEEVVASDLDGDGETEIELEWQTSLNDDGVGEVTVRSEDRADSAPIEIEPGEEIDWTGDADGSLDDIGDSTIDIDVDAITVG